MNSIYIYIYILNPPLPLRYLYTTCEGSSNSHARTQLMCMRYWDFSLSGGSSGVSFNKKVKGLSPGTGDPTRRFIGKVTRLAFAPLLPIKFKFCVKGLYNLIQQRWKCRRENIPTLWFARPCFAFLFGILQVHKQARAMPKLSETHRTNSTLNILSGGNFGIVHNKLMLMIALQCRQRFGTVIAKTTLCSICLLCHGRRPCRRKLELG